MRTHTRARVVDFTTGQLSRIRTILEIKQMKGDIQISDRSAQTS